ncbi:UTP--glucose-1-phosphate uridylyltransferase GalU [Endozoicomonadaceae bacterium StTr2]
MQQDTKIRKAVFPVAGLGTRFLPATKACPKEMLPVVDKPLIQYAVEEAIAAGVTDLIFVTSWNKRAIEDHFDKSFELEHKLCEAGKHELLETVTGIIPEDINCFYVRQKEALGLGHAVLCTRDIVGQEPFAVILADDLIYSPDSPCLQQMIAATPDKKANTIAIEPVLHENLSKYGIIKPGNKIGNLYTLEGIVEKPAPELAPSNLGAVGRYLLQPEIFDFLEVASKTSKTGEIQLTDAIAQLLQKQQVYGLQFDGIRYDCGSKLGYLKANLEYGLRHTRLGPELAQHIKKLVP